jgi:hypothetical protein
MTELATMTKRETAAALLAELFNGRERIPIAEAVEAAEARDVSRRTLTRAAADIGVTEVHNGRHGAFWELGGDK